MKLAVVVGANGFLGGAIVNELINKGINVCAVYNTHFDKINKLATLTNHQDLLTSDLQPDIIFYASGNYATPHDDLLKINFTLYQYSLKFINSKLVYVSSTNVYGIHNNSITENSTYNNPGVYALSKLSGEFIVSSMPRYSIIRLTYVYGTGISNNSFIPQVIRSAKDLGKITLFGNGGRMQDYIHINDVVNFCLASAQQQNNATYLCATGKSISNKEVAEEISKWNGCSVEYTGEDSGQSFHFDPQKTFNELNWFPKITFAEGIKEMLK